jgi:hypothetical protein
VYLIDTSAWIEALRKGSPLQLERLFHPEEIVTCLPVIQEVLQGIRDESAYRAVRDSLLAVTVVEDPLGQAVVDQAIDLFRSARRSGITPRSGVDCLIASCAIRHNLTIVHRDRDYDQIARVSALKVRSV